MKTKMVVMSVALFGLMIVPQVLAGSLEPATPPASTMKTLDEVEPRIAIPGSDTPVGPFEIYTPGSYYLTGDRNANSVGINIFVDNVTIDLKGYSLIGSGSFNGIHIAFGSSSNVEIRNGTVRNFGGSGILEDDINSKNHRVIEVRVIGNGISGINLKGNGHLIKDCTASDNGNSSSADVYGIYAGTGSMITGNIVYNNGASATGTYVYGIWIGSGSTITGNTAYDNGDSAIIVYGIYLDGNNLVDQNTSFNNGTGASGPATNMDKPGNCTFGINHTPAPL